MERVRPLKYKLITTEKFLRSLKKLDRMTQKIIKNFIDNNLENCTNPKAKGKALKNNLSGYWRYRIGSYRIICEIKTNEIIVVLVNVGHRKNIY